MRGAKGRFLVVGFSLMLGLAVAALFRIDSESIQHLELMALDQLMRLRAPQPIHERIVILGVDERTYRAVGRPGILWMPVFERAIRRLDQAGAAAVGVDWIFGHRIEGLGDSPPEQALRELLEGQELALGIAVTEGPNVLAEHLDEGGTETARQATQLRALALRPASGDRSNLAVLNVVTDPDGICRRVPFSFFEGRENDGQVRTFSLRLVELFTGQIFRREGQRLFLGDQEIPTEEGSLRVNFPALPTGAGTSFPCYSLAELLDPAVPVGEKYRGKICLIAPTAPADQDYLATPYHPETLGIELHAAAINTLLTRRFLRPAPPWLALLCVLGAAVGAGLVALLVERLTAVLGLLLGLAVYGGLALLCLDPKGLWLPLMPVALAGFAGSATGFLVRLGTTEDDRSQLRSTFGRMVSREVMEAVLKMDPEQITGGTEQRITVLFSDINDFTPICEKHAPAEITAMLSDYFDLMWDVICRHGGYLKQYVGDEIMVIFGAPNPQEDHAARAVRCGLEMLEALAARARERRAVPGFYDTKVGINTGDVVVGKVGTSNRWEYAAVGDEVNLGARVMGLTKKLECKMLVSENTRREAQAALPELEWKSRGEQEFKGKTERMAVYEVYRRS